MADELTRYKQKRHFPQTDEPPGEVAEKRSAGLRFVVQHHIASRDHYDFRLEWDGVLKSWAVPKGPSYDSHDRRLAVQVEDHPFDYRNFEGTIPKGEYGGGTVMLWDSGEWQPLVDVAEGLKNGSLKFMLKGQRLKGKWALVRMKPKPDEKGNNWLLIKEKDEFENAYNIKQFDTSIATGRTMAQIETGQKPKTDVLPKALKGGSAPVKTKKAKDMNYKLSDFNITNPQKVLYEESGVTKGDIAAYYLKIAKRMLPYVENRILSVVRCPQGIESACFYKKHPENNTGVTPVPLKAKDGTLEDYFYVKNIEGLMYEVQMNTLEFHTWGNRVTDLEKPDIMVFDLDPDEGLDLEAIRQGVKDLKSLLDQLSLASYLKTSGGKGYHVVIPFKPTANWDVFYAFAENTAKAMEAKWPERYTSNVRKTQRKNRIFIDWLRNGRGATSVAPYSVRAREGAPVSMPITWKELDKVAPQSITIKEAVARLRRKDPWAGFFDNAQQLK